MKYQFLSLALTALSVSSNLFSEPVCHKCEIIREYNKEHPGDYEYYDDYLEAEKKKAQEKKEALPGASLKDEKSGLPS